MKAVLAAFLALLALAASATERLVTDSYDITIDFFCEEGVVGCNRIRYIGVDRKTGKSIILLGEEMHTVCADRVSPCRFLGYTFRNGKTTYTVWENGYLSVKQGRKVLLEEKGTWDWQ